MVKNFLLILIWLLSLIFISIYTYEHPEKLETLKHYFNKYTKQKITSEKEAEKEKTLRVPGNSFVVELYKEIAFTEKTAFIVHNEDISNFDKNALKIYFQDGSLFENNKFKKLNLPNFFTTKKNGGIKTIFIYNDKEFALISSSKNECFYASIILLSNGKELFKTKCLPDKNIDYNGLGSSYIHYNDKIFLSIGTPEQASAKIRKLAQDKNSVFGKILEINKDDLSKVIKNEENNFNVKIFTTGHRNPQGLTIINNTFFSVEHGPRGGDELNKIIKGKNYGWPIVSYGTQYLYDEAGKYYEISHENNQFEEPLFAFVPSVGISSLNTCTEKLKKYYKKPCLLALSLFGNSIRPGKSIIIYLLNEEMNKVHSVEKIFVGGDFKFRHFVTNSKNELYEDNDGNIYVSADRKGIYKLSFVDFRN